jgi:hypothetical protein
MYYLNSVKLKVISIVVLILIAFAVLIDMAIVVNIHIGMTQLVARILKVFAVYFLIDITLVVVLILIVIAVD